MDFLAWGAELFCTRTDSRRERRRDAEPEIGQVDPLHSFAPFSSLSNKEQIVEASASGPFIGSSVAAVLGSMYDVVKVMGSGNLDMKIAKLEAFIKEQEPASEASGLAAHRVKALRSRVAALSSESAFKAAEQAITGARAGQAPAGAVPKKKLIMFDGDNCQADSPFTNFIAYLARQGYLVASVRGRVEPSAWAARHFDAETLRPLCTTGTWPKEAAGNMHMVWSDGASPAEVTLCAACSVIVYGSAEVLSSDLEAASQTTTSKEMQRFREFHINTTPASTGTERCDTDSWVTWALYEKMAAAGPRSSEQAQDGDGCR